MYKITQNIKRRILQSTLLANVQHVQPYHRSTKNRSFSAILYRMNTNIHEEGLMIKRLVCQI